MSAFRDGKEMVANNQRMTLTPSVVRAEEDGEKKGSRSSKRACIVDLDQFRNREVGEGFQADHVVRQSTGRVGVTVLDYSAGAKSAAVAPNKRKESPGERRLHYLQCRGMRELRKEIDRIGR